MVSATVKNFRIPRHHTCFILVNRILEIKRLGSVPLDLSAKILVIIGSVGSVGFGVWHFSVPEAWNWYSYIEPNATELVVAIRAINVFFSLALVLFGAVNMLLVYGKRANNYSIIVMLTATSILWITRVALQVIYPQGSMNPALQYGMLSAFIVVALCYIVPLTIMAFRELKLRSMRV